MKINGVEVNGPSEEVCVLPRMQGDLVFVARAVTDMGPFEKLCPEPKAKPILKKGGYVEDTESEEYQKMLKRYSELRLAYICVKSLEPSNIEWERVREDKPGTWDQWDQELKEAGLSTTEVNRVLLCIMQANALDESKLEKARESFLRGMEASAKSSGPGTAPPSSQSGEPAKG